MHMGLIDNVRGTSSASHPGFSQLMTHLTGYDGRGAVPVIPALVERGVEVSRMPDPAYADDPSNDPLGQSAQLKWQSDPWEVLVFAHGSRSGAAAGEPHAQLRDTKSGRLGTFSFDRTTGKWESAGQSAGMIDKIKTRKFDAQARAVLNTEATPLLEAASAQMTVDAPAAKADDMAPSLSEISSAGAKIDAGPSVDGPGRKL